MSSVGKAPDAVRDQGIARTLGGRYVFAKKEAASGGRVAASDRRGEPGRELCRSASYDRVMFSVFSESACSAAHDRIEKGGLKAIDRDRPIARQSRTKLRAALKRFFRASATDLVDQISHLLPDAAKAAGETVPFGLLSGVPGLDLSAWERDLPGIVSPILQAMAVAGADAALRQLGIFDKAIAARTRARAVEWATGRAAEMVGMKFVAGQLVANPNAVWRITDSVRVAMRDAVSQAIAEGESAGGLAARIMDDFAFSGSRAEMVARTEVAIADVAGTMEGYRESGIVAGKRWITAQDDRVSDECLACEDQGAIGLDDSFITGASAPPNHPNCRCDVLPVFGDEMPPVVARDITGE
jgi:SPP1 gp7 family putative phage head morphogenesis protein